MTLVGSYIDRDDADGYAGYVVDTSAWDDATEAQQEAALRQATAEIDMQRYAGMPYEDWQEGVENTQDREFPRIVVAPPAEWSAGKHMPHGRVCDWDDVNNEAVVPDAVKAATFRQALSLLRDTSRRSRLRDRHDGVASQSAGGFSESYDTARPITLLCLEARELLRPYLFRGGQVV